MVLSHSETNRFYPNTVYQGNGLTQVVQDGTRSEAILDLIITKMTQLYNKPTILPPIVLSDHQAVLWSHKQEPKKTEARVLPNQTIEPEQFWKVDHNQAVHNIRDATSKTAAFYSTLTSVCNYHFLCPSGENVPYRQTLDDS